MTSSQPQPYTTDYGMSQQTQAPEYSTNINEQAVNTLFNSADMEESNRGMDDALLGKVAPDTPVAAVHAQRTNLDDFDPDEIDYETLNTNTLPSPGLCWVLQDPSLNQQQTPYGESQQLYAAMRPMQSSYDQMQSPWANRELSWQGEGMQDIKQEHYTTSHVTMPLSTEQQSFHELRYPIPVHSTAPVSRSIATNQKASQESSRSKKQNKASATRQAQSPSPVHIPAQTTHSPAASAPQAMRFANFAEARQAAATRVVPHNYTPPANDASFPQDDASRKSYIRQMYDAYVDTTHCIDRVTVPNFDSHFAALASHPSTSPITPFMISTICWHLLTIAIDLHTRGPVCLDVYDPAKLKNVHRHRNLTFGARIDKVCELLRMSKSRCAGLLKLDGLGMVVANAPLLCAQTKSNYTHNANRQRDLVMGKSVLAARKRGIAQMDGGGDGAEYEADE